MELRERLIVLLISELKCNPEEAIDGAAKIMAWIVGPAAPL